MVTFSRYISISPNQRWVAEFLAEFLGTFLLVFMGNNGVAEAILTYGKGGSSVTIYLGYAIGLLLGILVSIGVSGAHLNPAVTVAGAIAKKFDSSKIFHYLLGQYLGAFVAACATYFVYMDSIEAFHKLHGINSTTATIFHTFPKEHLSVVGSFADQILGTMVLVVGIYAVTDKFNAKIPAHLVPFYITLVLLGIGCSLGVNQGYACNPARDLAPRIFTYLTDWGGYVFTANTYWYVPIIGPHIGAVLGAFVYAAFIEKLEIAKEGEIFDQDNKINYKMEANTTENVNQSIQPTESKYKEETKDLFKWDIVGALTGYDDDDEIAKREDEDSSSQSTCNCSEAKCDCCVDFNVSSIIDFGGPGCVTLKYISQTEGVSVNVSYGDSILHSQTVTDKNAQGTCMSLLSEFAQICARFSELNKVDDGLAGCLNFEPTILGEVTGQYHVGCFKMGPNGMFVDNSVANSTSEVDTEEDEEEEEKDATSPKPDQEGPQSFIEAVNQSAEESLAFFSNLLGFSTGNKKSNKNKSTTTESDEDASSTTEPARKRTKGKIRN